MTNLREEIKFYLSTYYDCASYDEAVEEILKLFEKKIDDIESANIPEEFMNSEYLTVREKMDFMHYRLALRDIKSMLKDES